MDTKWLRNSFVYLIILVAIIALFFTVFQPGGMDRDNTQISMNELAAAVKRGEVKRIDVAEDKLTDRDPPAAASYGPQGAPGHGPEAWPPTA